MKKAFLVVIAILGLGIGGFEYLGNAYGRIGQWLPDFFHSFSFSLLAIALFSSSKASRLWFCLLWFILDSTFEIGQRYGDSVTRYIPSQFDKFPVLNNTKNYFINGTFDLFDLVSIFLGVLAAYVTAEMVLGGKGYAKKQSQAFISAS